MSEDRTDAEADGDGGERDGGDEKIMALRKTVGGGGCENFSGKTAEHRKENAMVSRETGQIIDAP